MIRWTKFRTLWNWKDQNVHERRHLEWTHVVFASWSLPSNSEQWCCARRLGERLRFIAHVIINLACQRIMFSQSLVMIEQTTQKLLRAGENLQTCCVTRQIIFPTSSIIARIKSDPLVDELLGLWMMAESSCARSFRTEGNTPLRWRLRQGIWYLWRMEPFADGRCWRFTGQAQLGFLSDFFLAFLFLLCQVFAIAWPFHWAWPACWRASGSSSEFGACPLASLSKWLFPVPLFVLSWNKKQTTWFEFEIAKKSLVQISKWVYCGEYWFNKCI